MTNTPGHLQERPLIEEIIETVMGDYIPSPDIEDIVYRDTVTVLAILRRRGLLNLQGLEIIKREME